MGRLIWGGSSASSQSVILFRPVLCCAGLWHAQHLEFVVLDQAQDGAGTPSLDRVHVEIKVSIPRGAKDTVAFLSGTKRDAKPSVSEGQVINAQGVGGARSNQSRLLLISIRFDFKL